MLPRSVTVATGRFLGLLGGWLTSQFLTLYVTPVFYVLIDRLRPPSAREPARAAPEAAA